jgi:hypothetical protein
MTSKEIQKRNTKSETLRVLQTDEGSFYVESAEGKILYKVIFDDDQESCTCGDYARNIQKEPRFKCKHLLSVMNSIPTGQVENSHFLERTRPKLNENWVIEIEGNQFVKYAGLLDLGHQKGISQIEVEVLQLPTKDNGNCAICKATVVSKVGESFTDIGDANPGNCSSKVSKHLLRLSSTRAIARALRTFTNIGMTCLEELADLSDVVEKGNGHETQKNTPRKAAAGKPKAAPKETPRSTPTLPENNATSSTSATANQTQEKPAPVGNSNGDAQPGISQAQTRAIHNLSRRRGISVQELENMAMDSFGVEIDALSAKDASALIRSLQQAA